jgi:hypothetical protein
LGKIVYSCTFYFPPEAALKNDTLPVLLRLWLSEPILMQEKALKNPECTLLAPLPQKSISTYGIFSSYNYVGRVIFASYLSAYFAFPTGLPD